MPKRVLDISIEKGEATIDELKEMEITDLIKSFEVKTKCEVRYPVADQLEVSYVETFVILLNSALESDGTTDIQFCKVNSFDIKAYGFVKVP